MFLEKTVLKICSKFTEEHPWRRTISIKLQSNFIEITIRYGCSLVNLLHIFRTPFPKNTTGGLLGQPNLISLLKLDQNPAILLKENSFKVGGSPGTLLKMNPSQAKVCNTAHLLNPEICNFTILIFFSCTSLQLHLW